MSSAGDVNSDGVEDLIIGAFNDDSYAFGTSSPRGVGYILLGSRTPAITRINGVYHFNVDSSSVKINTYGDYEYVGFSVSYAGDVNHDGIGDVIIGAPGTGGNSPNWPLFSINNGIGASYVVFGDKERLFPGKMINLGDVDQTGVLQINGESIGDLNGCSVSSAGDVNADGIFDFIIGAPHASPYGKIHAGITYVIFGKRGLTGFFNLTNLNGVNGFKICGVSSNDRNGIVVNPAEDINADGISDLIIGVASASPDNQTHAGVSYVIFGKVGIGGQGIFNLTQLDGTNGFVINGETAGSLFGASAGSAGDINADGIADLIIGAMGYNNNTGRSYVIFGNSGLGSSGQLYLSGLNGKNGFKIDGELPGDYSGHSVSVAKDFNGDKINDLIIGANSASQALKWAGRTYVIFGNPLLDNNGSISLANLNGINGFKINGEAEGQLSGTSVASLDINADGLTDIVIGAPKTSYLEGCSECGASYVVYGDETPQLVNNCLTILEGQTVILNSSYLNATYFRSPGSLIFNVINIQHGYFTPVDFTNAYFKYYTMRNPKPHLTGFLQSEVPEIQFVHDGSKNPPAYSIKITSGGVALPAPPQPATIYFTTFDYYSLVIINNSLIISQGETVLLTSANLAATNPNNDNSDDLIFTITQFQHGAFSFINTPKATISSFRQGDISASIVQFTQDGTNVAPSYYVTISEGTLSTGPIKALISFVGKPWPVEVIMKAVLSSMAGILLLLVAGYYYRAYHLNKKRELANPFANKIHERLNLVYNDFADKEGKEYSDIINNMIFLINEKSGVNINELEKSRDLHEQKLYHQYADLFAAKIRRHITLFKNCFNETQFSRRELQRESEKIVNAVITDVSSNVSIELEDKKACCLSLRNCWGSFFSKASIHTNKPVVYGSLSERDEFKVR